MTGSISFSCAICRKKFYGRVNTYFEVYRKCQGKICPDCGKPRRLGVVKGTEINPLSFNCSQCGR